MKKRRALDIAIVLCEVASIILVHFLIEDTVKKIFIIAIMSVVAVFFAILFIRDGRRYLQEDFVWAGNGPVSQVVLLSEEDTEVACWDIYGKASIVFGRDESGHKRSMGANIDIDLKDTDFAASVDREHAVMNYYDGGWYLEDLESENGVRVQRAGEADKYKVSSGTPYRVGRGDVIYLGLTKLKVR